MSSEDTAKKSSADAAGSGVRDTVVETCHKQGLSYRTFYLSNNKYSGLGLNELCELLTCARRTRS